MVQPHTIVVRAPATCANLGPGFDCLGLALDLWNEVVATPAAELSVSVSEDSSSRAPIEDNLVLKAARAVFERLDEPFPPIELRCTNHVPVGRGLGSSAAAIACGVLLANRYVEDALSTREVLDMAAQLEGHPDNVAACLLGGVRAAALDTDRHVVQASVPLRLSLQLVVFVPDVGLPTALARAALPTSVEFADAIFNVGRVGLMVASLASGDGSLLREAMRDRLHQPYRAPLFPTGPKLIKAAIRAGAFGACISGAGPSVLALCPDKQIATAVQHEFDITAQQDGVPGTSRFLTISHRGAYIAQVN
jgi:homoserine kinase